jgi:elongation factor Ts
MFGSSRPVSHTCSLCHYPTEAAGQELRKKGLAAAGKKASRSACEGLVGVAHDRAGRAAAIVEINSETDFVARNEQFTALVGRVAAAALAADHLPTTPGHELDVDALGALRMGEEGSVADAVVALAGSMRENIRLRRAFRLAARGPAGVVGTYVHAAVGHGLGRIAGLVALEGSDVRVLEG